MRRNLKANARHARRQVVCKRGAQVAVAQVARRYGVARQAARHEKRRHAKTDQTRGKELAAAAARARAGAKRRGACSARRGVAARRGGAPPFAQRYGAT